jgi:phosphoserine phosphatase RsbU/P
METLLSDAPCLYFSSNDDGTILAVNNRLCRQLGFSEKELIGQKQDLFFTVGTRIFQQTHLFPLLTMQGHADEIYITLQTKDKEHLPLLVNVERKVVADRAVNTFVGIVVYNRKKFEDDLVAARNAAEKALNENTALSQAKRELQQHAELLDQQMSLVKKQNEELRQFNRVVTHDLQEPLRKLLVFTNLLLEKDAASSSSKTVRKIKSIAEQMRSLVSGLQQYVWLTDATLKPVAVSLPTLFQRLSGDLRQAHPQVSISIEADHLPTIYGDAEQLGLLFTELLRNAVRFRKPDANVLIRVKATELQQNTFRAISDKYRYSTYIRVELSDNGTGFDALYKEQVFELFKRLHNVSGRGIGLSLCKKIVENHNGSISIDSRAGEGATVSILLPVQKPSTSSAKESDSVRSNHKTSNGN